ncbi:caspase family protein [Fimbriiglobus ruber]|uniref:Caspase family p20 domain-containing protein n=1 Tax=Fimbriiglobus ruber TaxID=1908690 RepID=A0A225DPI2_9BACT|nr:caspase family protein [Fimbriiglobus ruber]OWK42983.1 hypothetical protein FRUB_02582 [Fimbriiglobus ruber]
MRTRLLFAVLIAVTVAPDAPAAGKRYAVCIGVNQYASDKLDTLGCAVADATVLADVLRDAGYEVALLTPAAARTAPAAAPTWANIAARLDALCAGKEPGDTVVLAFIGHGARFRDDPDYYLCPKDAQPVPDRKQTLVSVADIYTQLGRCKAGSKVFLCDGCRTDPTPGRPQTPNDVLGTTPPPGVFALFACGVGERGYEHAALGHGVFTHHLLAELNPPARDANVDLNFTALATHVTREAPATAARWLGSGARQTPTTRVGSGPSPVLLTPADSRLLADRVEVRAIWARGGKSTEYVERVVTERIGEWKEAATRGSAIGMFLLAKCLETGRGIPQDAKAAVAWYRNAADHGDAGAMTSLAGCYVTGTGVIPDQKAMLEWLHKAADHGDADAMSNLGAAYLLGQGVATNHERGFAWVRKAAALGEPSGLYYLGLCYRNGLGVARDAEEAVACFRKAAELNDSMAMTNLGGCYQKGIGVPADAAKAVEWYRLAADLKDPVATCLVGCCYERGIGVEKDPKAAVAWYRKAADLGDVAAMGNLGLCYLDGEGVEKNAYEATSWLRKAVDLNDPEAMARLGDCYLHGTGVRYDDVTAIALYRKGVSMNDPGPCTAWAAATKTGWASRRA